MENQEEKIQEDVQQKEGLENIPTSFTEIIKNKDLLKTLTEQGFEKPTEVQARTVPMAREGSDAIVQAQTGSGKTLAFLLPLCEILLDEKTKTNPKETFALLIAPTRELAVQIEQVFSELDIGITPNVLIGGVDMEKQKKTLNKDKRVVIGTPGRLLDFLKQRLFNLSKCRYFVLDEADEMLSMGFIEDVRAILSRLPDKRQGLMVSATISGRVEMLAHSFLSKPKRISTVDRAEDAPDISHEYVEVASDLMAKPKALCDIIEVFRPRSAIIFCNTKSDTKLVEVLLRRRGFDARRINSDLNQSQRTKIMKLIKAEDLQFLIGTDIAARGIDIAQIDLVVNYNIHDQHETYVHRTGRTGRAGRSGRAISLIGPRDHGAFHHLKKMLDIDFKKIDLPSDEDVSGAKLSHLYEMVRNAKVEIGDRDTIMAKKLLSDLGQIEDPSEALINFTARLCKKTTENFVREEAKSLDEELTDKEESSKKNSKRKDRDRGKNGDKRHDRKSRSKDSGDREDRDSREPRKKEPVVDEVRVYIGQGTKNGMNPSEFKTLAKDKAELESKDLKKLTIREHYGFVDLMAPLAEKLIESMNGIQHNDDTLVVERAAVLNDKPRRKRHNNNRRDNNRRDRDSRNSNSRKR